jgi:hypothetical protein
LKPANSLRDPISKNPSQSWWGDSSGRVPALSSNTSVIKKKGGNPITKIGLGGVAQGVGPELTPYYHKKGNGDIYLSIYLSIKYLYS